MLQTLSVQGTEPLRVVCETLRERGFDAAEACARALVADGASPQLHADLCASAGRFEHAYHSASAANAEAYPADRFVRLALFADLNGHHAVAAAAGARAIDMAPPERSIAWIAWIIAQCGAPAAAIHLLHAYEKRVPNDARAAWWFAQVLASVHGESAAAERRDAVLRAYALDPDLHPALPLHAALALRERRDWDSVMQVARRALSRNPADAELAWQLSHAQWQLGDARQAEATMRVVDASVPGNAAVQAAIGMYLAEQARYGDSEAALRASLALDPACVEAAVDLAELELRRDDWASAWPRYEARLARTDREARNIVNVMAGHYPRWRGEPLFGKTLVVHSEQGNGDDLQMVRFLPRLAARVRDEGGRVVLACRRPLHPLFARFIEPCVAIEDGLPGDAHYALPMMSVPFAIGLQPEQVSGAAYLHADENPRALWRDLVRAQARSRACAGEPLLHAGLVWSGSPTHRRDAQRSIPLEALLPLRSLKDVMFHPLTPGKEVETETLAQLGFSVCNLTGHYRQGFDDVAAHVAALDVVVTIDSAPLHLAGALGRPVLAMLDHVSHWCWGIGETQRWYDSVELFRQPAPGAWAPVVERITGRLADGRYSARHQRTETVR
ncbi:tetratricopeptide repeat protein [Paraburkholderia rhizosphaerae]|uniref:Glycosyl transferase family 9 (Putative heptosyltransferase) n=1 Tax=Paraburkholderia rhizosphaerae TaxID=480658 RepID=A0A4R8L3N1_9BURK|nr:tetratricopeptide repeat protein [Paraburkholderia rhizosphaerae]TDY37176.1 glycosyl transferase family 9 (putative heptosyltransferase) [Paraburkholderia rhizosphaerae]